MTPIFFRSKSPMLRVMANLPLTFGCPRLFQVIKPPLLFILDAGAEGERYKKKHFSSERKKKTIIIILTISLSLRWIHVHQH